MKLYATFAIMNALLLLKYLFTVDNLTLNVLCAMTFAVDVLGLWDCYKRRMQNDNG